MTTRVAAGVLATALALAPSVHGDRLHLAGGGTIDTERWWVEGETIYYDTAAGTVGIPRALVERVDDAVAVATRSGTPALPSARAARGARHDWAADLAAASAALEARDFELAASLYRDVLLVEPEAADARVGYAMAQMGLGADGSALPVIREGLLLDPRHAGLHEALGMLLDRDERVDEALAEYHRAFELAPSDRLREKILRAERELLAARDFDFAVSSHFNVRYDGDIDVALADRILGVLEELHATLTDRYRFTPMQPIVVQLLPREAFRAVTQAPEWVGGVYDGKIRVPLGGLSHVGPAAERLLAHELTHAIVHSKSRGAAPRWLQEGLAQMSEGRTLDEADAVSIRKLLAEHPASEWDRLPFRYDLALALTSSLAEARGFDSLLDVLDDLARGREIDAALLAVYGAPYSGLLRACGDALLDRGRP